MGDLDNIQYWPQVFSVYPQSSHGLKDTNVFGLQELLIFPNMESNKESVLFPKAVFILSWSYKNNSASQLIIYSIFIFSSLCLLG